jgi:hypothetical protein
MNNLIEAIHREWNRIDPTLQLKLSIDQIDGKVLLYNGRKPNQFSVVTKDLNMLLFKMKHRNPIRNSNNVKRLTVILDFQ